MKTFMEEYSLIVVAAIIIMLMVVAGPVFGNQEAHGIVSAYKKISLMGQPGPGGSMLDGKNLSWKQFMDSGNGDKYGYDASKITDTELKNRAFSNCDNLTSIIIPEGVTTIGEYAFWGCKNLGAITMPDTVTSIKSDAFRGTGITSVKLSANLQSISNGMFRECTSLEELVIPKGVTRIGIQAFLDCKSLTTLVVPKTVNYIGENAFVGSGALKEVEFEGTIAEWNAIEKDRFWNGSITEVHCADGVTAP